MSNTIDSEENRESQEFVKAYGQKMFNEGKDVSYDEIPADGETILKYYNPTTGTAKTIIIVNDEYGFEIQLSTVVNGHSTNIKIFPSLDDLKEYLNQPQL